MYSSGGSRARAGHCRICFKSVFDDCGHIGVHFKDKVEEGLDFFGDDSLVMPVQVDHDLECQHSILLVVSAEDLHEEGDDGLCEFLVDVIEGETVEDLEDAHTQFLPEVSSLTSKTLLCVWGTVPVQGLWRRRLAVLRRGF
jgi:hypothetical protein